MNHSGFSNPQIYVLLSSYCNYVFGWCCVLLSVFCLGVDPDLLRAIGLFPGQVSPRNRRQYFETSDLNQHNNIESCVGSVECRVKVPKAQGTAETRARKYWNFEQRLLVGIKRFIPTTSLCSKRQHFLFHVLAVPRPFWLFPDPFGFLNVIQM